MVIIPINIIHQLKFLFLLMLLDLSSLMIDYDEEGNLASARDALGNETNYSYNKKGMVTNISDGIGEYMKFTYDSHGQIISSINGAGEVASFTYDEEGNCISKTLSKSGEKGLEEMTENYSYDLEGKLTKVIYADGSITNVEYNSIGKMSAAIDEKGRRTEYDYDLFGNLTHVQYHDNTSESFLYDAEGRNSDPTGYFTLSEQGTSLAIIGILMTAAAFSGIVIISNMRRFLQSSIGDRSKPQPIRCYGFPLYKSNLSGTNILDTTVTIYKLPSTE